MSRKELSINMIFDSFIFNQIMLFLFYLQTLTRCGTTMNRNYFSLRWPKRREVRVSSLNLSCLYQKELNIFTALPRGFNWGKQALIVPCAVNRWLIIWVKASFVSVVCGDISSLSDSASQLNRVHNQLFHSIWIWLGNWSLWTCLPGHLSSS